MTAPRSIRFDDSTLERLTAYCLRHQGLSQSSAVALLVEEGLRMDLHPGIVFRDGPTGRRASLVAGPDVWELVRAIRQLRAHEPDVVADEAVSVVAEAVNVPASAVKTAVAYYSAFPDEIDQAIELAEAVEAEAIRQDSRAKELLEA
ncbi:MAG: hypothetical protein ACO3UW_13365 [Candidatus Nanopelagicales bacterium]